MKFFCEKILVKKKKSYLCTLNANCNYYIEIIKMRKLLFTTILACINSMIIYAQEVEHTEIFQTTDAVEKVDATESTETTKVNITAKPKFSLKPDSAFLALSLKERFFYGYNFDVYYHHNTRDSQKSNGWSISVTPEFGYKISPKAQVGLRLGGSYSSMHTDYIINNDEGKSETRNLRISSGSWEVTPFGRYRLKTLFNDKVGIWLEMHLYTGMEFPRVTAGDSKGTDYDGLRQKITYGAQVSPVITYQFNSKSTFQIFFSILSFGYSGTTSFYSSADKGKYREYSNDVIIFSGKLSNLIANQFTPGLYGLKFGVQKKF